MIATAVARTARAHPDHPAVLDASGRATSYAELADRVERLAGALGPGPGRVGLLVDHGLDTIVALLATLAAGATYVPLDPHLPDDRLALMLADADARALIVGPGLDGRLAHPRPVPVDAAGPPLVPVEVGPEEPAYLLYTSGSTGVPKGVLQTHASIGFQAGHHIERLGIGPGDRVSVLSSFGFDMAVTDTFAALLSGAAVVPVDVRALGLGLVADVLTGQRVSVYHSTPTVFRYLLDALPAGHRLSALRAVLLGGERVIGADLRRFRDHCGPDAVFINGYGATEISFAAQYHLSMSTVEEMLAASGDAPVAVGPALPGVGIAVDGEEIVLRSRYLARYWRDPDRNAERFRPGPDGVPEYRTGDRGRLRPDGVLEYLGRLDRQVKIRGNRVELAEVEAVLSGLPGVEQVLVAVTPVAGPSGVEDQLTGYVRPAGALTATAARTALARILPEYAVPQRFVFVDDFPLTATGKADAAALARRYPPVAVTTGAELSLAVGAPVATTVRAVWGAVLGLSDVPADTNFFDLGGHSLQMAQVQRHLERALGRRVALTTLYTHATVRALTAHLEGDAVPVGPDRRAVDRMARRRQARTREENP